MFKILFITDSPSLLADVPGLDLDELNNSTYCKPFRNAKDLRVGDHAMVETETFKCILPEKYYNFFNGFTNRHLQCKIENGCPVTSLGVMFEVFSIICYLQTIV
ncbi:hypothetical protein PPYR_02318 [Photinus pyralis]|uniref:Uncharacterized protein n=2 Tax=Photinus pyralis TaxID=7054 RepID=A0A5N4B713_PHOPY|nr:hypothetical protein PPYR_02318 [Photinus pyralis]